MKLIVGLGNPGVKYAKTRHNVGFLVVEALSRIFNLQFSILKHKSEIFLGKDIILIKPQTFMNLSGEAVAAVKSYYKIETSDIWVIHDDVDFEAGKMKIQVGGGSAGHNGLKSIIETLGESDFVRFRVGVGRPVNVNIPVEDFVLQNLTGGEAIDKCAAAVEIALEKGIERAMNEYNK